MKGDRLHLPYNLSTNHKNAVDFFEELCIIEKEANSVSAKLFFRTCKVFFGRRGLSGQPEQGMVSAMPFLSQKDVQQLQENLKAQNKRDRPEKYIQF